MKDIKELEYPIPAGTLFTKRGKYREQTWLEKLFRQERELQLFMVARDTIDIQPIMYIEVNKEKYTKEALAYCQKTIKEFSSE